MHSYANSHISKLRPLVRTPYTQFHYLQLMLLGLAKLLLIPSNQYSLIWTVRKDTFTHRLSKYWRYLIIASISSIDHTVRPRDKQPQAARTLTMHVFEKGPKNLKCTNLFSENLKLHGFFHVLNFVLLSNSSCTNFEQHESFHSPKNKHFKALL